MSEDITIKDEPISEVLPFASVDIIENIEVLSQTADNNVEDSIAENDFANVEEPQDSVKSNPKVIVGDEPSGKILVKPESQTIIKAKRMRCKNCFKYFHSLDAVKRHCRIHAGLLPYPCTLCQKSFSTSQRLTMHLRSHTLEKPRSEEPRLNSSHITISYAVFCLKKKKQKQLKKKNKKKTNKK